MLVQDFKNTVYEYDNFEVWEVKDLEDFFTGNGVLKEIFEKEYKIPLVNLKVRRNEIVETDPGLMASVLDMVADKYFFPFSLNDANHLELIYLQESKIMSFGINIANVDEHYYYVIIMDKAKKAGVGL